MLCGDFNASIAGRDDDDDSDNIGIHGDCKETKLGKRFMCWLKANQLCTMSSYFQKKTHCTWVHPGQKTDYQLDHIVTDQVTRSRRKITNCGVVQQVIYSDHSPVEARLEMRSDRIRRTPASARDVAVKRDFSMLQPGGKSNEERKAKESFRY